MVWNSWQSFKLTSLVAAIILREYLGYDVQIFYFSGYGEAYSNGDYYHQPPYFDVDFESWLTAEVLVTNDNSAQKLYEDGAIDVPLPIGYNGRTGLYVPDSALKDTMADYYKIYSIPGYARSKGFLGADPTALRAAYEAVGEPFPACGLAAAHCRTGNDTYAGYYIPPWCEKNMSACIEVWMMSAYDPGYFEQLSLNNGKLYMVFAYVSDNVALYLRKSLFENPRNVVFYSWFPNWGADGQGAVRLSYPDHRSGCSEPNPNHPEGPVSCDKKHSTIRKLISMQLQDRGPEAFFFIRQFLIDRNQLAALFAKVLPDEPDQGLFRAACSAVKTDPSYTQLFRTSLWSCALSVDNDLRTFHNKLGVCRLNSVPHDQTFQCFPDDAPVLKGLAKHKARAKVNIRIASRYWTSHQIMEKIIGILLTEHLGYTVSYEDADDIPNEDWGNLLESGIADIEPESWFGDPDDPNYNLYVNEKSVALIPTIVGFVRNVGWYVTPETLKDFPFADYYRFFQGTEARDAGFSVLNKSLLINLTEVMEARGGRNPKISWINEGGYYSPQHCLDDPDKCIELIMPYPHPQDAAHAQLINNYKLNINMAYYGEIGAFNRVKELYQAGKRMLFHHWKPGQLLAEMGILSHGGRVSFPDWYAGCDEGVDSDALGPLGSIECDRRMVKVRKIVATALSRRAAEAVYAVEHLTVFDDQMNAAFEYLYGAGKSRTVYDAACWLLKNYTEILKEAAPACISTPIDNAKVRMGDEFWNLKEKECIPLSCPNRHRLQFVEAADRVNDTDASCGPCASRESPGLIPTADQLGCIACGAGETAVEGVRCTRCPIGAFTAEKGRTECEKCHKNRYNPLVGAIQCAACPIGGLCEEGSSMFIAEEGYYILGGEDQDKNVQEAFRAWQNSTAFNPDEPHGFAGIGPFNCPAKQSCIGGNRCLQHDGKPAMEGPFCGACAKGFTRSYAVDVCSECPHSSQNVAFLVLGLLVFALVIIIIDRVNSAQVGNLRETSAVVMKIMCNFFILLSVIAVNCNLKSLLNEIAAMGAIGMSYTRPLLALLNIGQALENPGKAIFSVGCLVSDSNYTIYPEHMNVLIAWLVIPVCVVFACLILLIVKYFNRTFEYNNVCQSIVCAIMYFMHPMVTSLFLGSFDCVWLDQETKMKYGTMRHALNMNIDCQERQHINWMWASAAGMMFWSLGIPLFYWLKLRSIVMSRGKSLHDPDVMRQYGFLYDGFEPEQYYYETIYMIRKAFYLITATYPWLLDQSRTVLLLALNFMFLSMHLKYQPFDNRAYFGLDRLETWASITLIFLLLGRLLEQALLSIPGQILEDQYMFSYLPALLSLTWFLAQASYLFFRSAIWPIDGDCPCLPKRFAFLEERLVFSLIPVSYDEKDPEHSLLGDKSGSWRDEAEPRGKLHQRERELLKSILTESVELILRRHELCCGRAPAQVCLPSLLVQLERIVVISLSVAIRSRIKSKYRNMHRDTWWKFFKGLGEDTLTYAEDLLHARGKYDLEAHLTRDVDWTDVSCKNLRQELDLIERPVSAEELHMGLMTIMPTLLDVKKNAEGNELRRLAFENKGILDMSTAATWLFEKDSHLSRLCHYYPRDVEEQAEKMRLDEPQEVAENDDLPQVEIWEDPLGGNQGTNWSMQEGADDEAQAALTGLSGLVGNRSLGPYSACRELMNLQDPAALVADDAQRDQELEVVAPEQRALESEIAIVVPEGSAPDGEAPRKVPLSL